MFANKQEAIEAAKKIRERVELEYQLKHPVINSDNEDVMI